MTLTKQTREKNKLSFAAVILGVLSLVTLFLLLRAPTVTYTRMSEALNLCTKTLIPSLFPFMVVSELLLSGDCADLLSPILRRPAKFLFGISGEGAVAVLLGAFCGFPIGAKGAMALYKGGRIDGDEVTRIIAISSIPSAPFLISTVGSTMFGNSYVGLQLLAASLISSSIIGVILKNVKLRSTRNGQRYADAKVTSGQSTAHLITTAISSSALSMLYICAFLTFFSTLVGVAEYSLSALSLSDGTRALSLGFFELTGGIRRASEIEGVGLYLAAAVSGWSGLSVHFQIISVCSGCNISYKPYFFSKLGSAALTTILMGLLQLL